MPLGWMALWLKGDTLSACRVVPVGPHLPRHCATPQGTCAEIQEWAGRALVPTSALAVATLPLLQAAVPSSLNGGSARPGDLTGPDKRGCVKGSVCV